MQRHGRTSSRYTHDHRCVSCNGIGKKLTLRGLAAKNYFEQLIQQVASSIKGKGIIYFQNEWHPFVKVYTKLPVNHVILKINDSTEIRFLPNTLLTVAKSKEKLIDSFNESIEYQNNLTTKGTKKQRKSKTV